MEIDPKVLANFLKKAPKELSSAELVTEFMKQYTEGNPLRCCKLFLNERKVSGVRYKEVMNFISVQVSGKPLTWSDD